MVGERHRGLIVNTKFQICIHAGNSLAIAQEDWFACKTCCGLPENKKAIIAARNVSAPTFGYSERITFARAELLSSMVPTAAAQEGTQQEKHGTKKHYNV
jgi:hypothetical protein